MEEYYCDVNVTERPSNNNNIELTLTNNLNDYTNKSVKFLIKHNQYNDSMNNHDDIKSIILIKYSNTKYLFEEMYKKNNELLKHAEIKYNTWFNCNKCYNKIIYNLPNIIKTICYNNTNNIMYYHQSSINLLVTHKLNFINLPNSIKIIKTSCDSTWKHKMYPYNIKSLIHIKQNYIPSIIKNKIKMTLNKIK